MSELLARLLSAGTDPALVAEVAREMGRLEGIAEAAHAPDRAAENRRAYDRERKRAAKADVSGGIPVDSAETAEPIPSLDKSPHTPKINPTPLVHTHEARARAVAWPCPEGVEPAHWQDFLTARKRKRLVNTQTALDGVLADIAELSNDEWPPGRLVRLAAAKGWGSINKPDGYQNGRPTTNSMGRNGVSASGHGSVVDSAQRVIARHAASAGGQFR